MLHTVRVEEKVVAVAKTSDVILMGSGEGYD